MHCSYFYGHLIKYLTLMFITQTKDPLLSNKVKTLNKHLYQSKQPLAHWLVKAHAINRASAPENQQSAYAKTKTQISCAVTAQLISVFVFASQIGKSPFLNPEFSSFSLASVNVQPCLCRTWSETQIGGFHMRRLKIMC